MDVNRAKTKPDAALPWPGYDRGLIICKSCGHAGPDDDARNGRVHRCEMCSKVIYIPSGLHSPYYEPNIIRRINTEPEPGFSTFWYNFQDVMGAWFKKFTKRKTRWPIVLIVILGVGFLLLNTVFSKGNDGAVVDQPSPAKLYYQTILPVRGSVTQAIENFRIIAGDVPQKNTFSVWRNPANRERFTRACDETNKVIVAAINQVRAMRDQGFIPPETINHQTKFLDMLYIRQKFYANLKDGLNNNDQAKWNAAFDLKDQMSQTFSDENAALESLRDLVLNSKNASK